MEQKQKNEFIITGILVIILAFILVSNLKRIKTPRRVVPGRAVKAVTAYAKPQKKAKVRKKAGKPKAKVTYAQLKQQGGETPFIIDPFAGGAAPSEGAAGAELLLNGILWDKDNPLAVINDNMVKVGDKIGNNKVVAIGQDYVILNDGTKDFRLNLE